jgi:hypothetical protein
MVTVMLPSIQIGSCDGIFPVRFPLHHISDLEYGCMYKTRLLSKMEEVNGLYVQLSSEEYTTKGCVMDVDTFKS